MTKRHIEMWAIQLMDQAVARQHVEDSHAELKGQWPDVSSVGEARKTARQIAGHANAARGEPIIWLIGVDERAGRVTGADPVELSNWWAAVSAEFDGLAPGLTDINVLHEGQIVVALYFETDRSPFVVKNPAYGSPSGGPVALEVPWRGGRATRTAPPSETVRMFTPV